MTQSLDEDALIASFDLIGRSGATAFEFGYLHEDVPTEQAGWWAKAQYRGTRVTEEDHRDPVAAIEALARRILSGGMCTHCGGLIALSDRGAVVHAGATMLDGSVMTEERARSLPQCRWRRLGRRWERGCAEPARPNRAARRHQGSKRGRR